MSQCEFYDLEQLIMVENMETLPKGNVFVSSFLLDEISKQEAIIWLLVISLQTQLK